jgi:hypothetical protein
MNSVLIDKVMDGKYFWPGNYVSVEPLCIIVQLPGLMVRVSSMIHIYCSIYSIYCVSA